MGILEIGVNLGRHKLLSVRFYSQEDLMSNEKLNSFSDLRDDFIAAIDDLAAQVFGENLNAVSLSDYRVIYNSERLRSPYDDKNLPLICYSITENSDNDTEWLKKVLKEVSSQFLNRYSLYTIFSPGEVDFQKFEPRIHDILTDLRIKIQESFRDLFRS
jgi:hypothetical protein